MDNIRAQYSPETVEKPVPLNKIVRELMKQNEELHRRVDILEEGIGQLRHRFETFLEANELWDGR